MMVDDAKGADEILAAKGADATADDAQQAPSDPAAQIVETLNNKIGELSDELLRLLAEMDNFRKRSARAMEDIARHMNRRFAHDLISVAAHMAEVARAVPHGAGERNSALRALLEGLVLMEREFLAVLARYGVNRVVPLGDPFDASLHEAVGEIHQSAGAPGTIVEVIEAGFSIGEQVIRRPKVVVAKGDELDISDRSVDGALPDT
jgi:molecular chaperone GrpE